MNRLYMMLALLAALAGTHYMAYVKGKVEAREEAAVKEGDRVKKEQQATLQRIKQNEREAEQQELNRVHMKEKHENEITQLRADYARAPGLRINAGICAGFTATPDAKGAGVSDSAAARTGALPEKYDRDIKKLMMEADAIVEGCRVAQDFIKSNGMAP